MTKKDYIIIAREINALCWNYQGQTEQIEVLLKLSELLSQEFIADNPRFNKDKFINACFKK